MDCNFEIEETATYSDEGVKVLEGKTDVTKKATIKTTYTLEGETVKDMSARGNYIITYNITYNDFKTTLTRKVFLK